MPNATLPTLLWENRRIISRALYSHHARDMNNIGLCSDLCHHMHHIGDFCNGLPSSAGFSALHTGLPLLSEAGEMQTSGPSHQGLMSSTQYMPIPSRSGSGVAVGGCCSAGQSHTAKCMTHPMQGSHVLRTEQWVYSAAAAFIYSYTHTYSHTTHPLVRLHKDTLETSSLFTNTPSWAVPVTDSGCGTAASQK